MTSVSRVLTADAVLDDGDMRLLRALPHAAQKSLGPFVFIDHYRHKSRRGIGDKPHPHAGIEVVSYLLEGEVQHRDSLGFRDRLGPGDAQHIRSGRGMLHAEQPLGGRHGLQLWVSLPSELKEVEPSYRPFRAAEIPVVVDDRSSLRIIAGVVNGTHGPMRLSGAAVFAHARLEPGARMTLHFDPDLDLGLYVLQGGVTLDGRSVVAGKLAVLERGSHVEVEALGPEAVDFALVGGAPLLGEVLFSGPFVMDTPERLAKARHDFSAGRMGRLEGVPF